MKAKRELSVSGLKEDNSGKKRYLYKKWEKCTKTVEKHTEENG